MQQIQQDFKQIIQELNQQNFFKIVLEILTKTKTEIDINQL